MNRVFIMYSDSDQEMGNSDQCLDSLSLIRIQSHQKRERVEKEKGLEPAHGTHTIKRYLNQWIRVTTYRFYEKPFKTDIQFIKLKLCTFSQIDGS